MIGILGGLGPAAGCRFYDMLIRMCPALRDQEHPDVILYGKASVPDRSAFLLGRSDESPLPAMIGGLRTLEQAGARLIAIPCATAHHFHSELQSAIGVPILNMLALTAQFLAQGGVTRAALLATEGSYRSGAFYRALEAAGIAAIAPAEDQVQALMGMIYAIKSGNLPGKQALEDIAKPLLEQGAQRVVLGCTEFSLVGGLSEIYVDPMRILAQEILLLAASNF